MNNNKKEKKNNDKPTGNRCDQFAYAVFAVYETPV